MSAMTKAWVECAQSTQNSIQGSKVARVFAFPCSCLVRVNPLVLDSMCVVCSVLLLDFPRHLPISNQLHLATQENIWRHVPHVPFAHVQEENAPATQVKVLHSHIVLPVADKTLFSKCTFAATAAFWLACLHRNICLCTSLTA